MNLPSPGAVVIVHWLDIQVDYGWTAPDAVLGAASCYTVGVVIEVTAQTITLAACVGEGVGDEPDEVNLRAAIPLGCITSWAPLRKGKSVCR